MSSGITRDDWLNAVKAADATEASDSDALTVEEFARVIGMGRQSATLRLRRLLTLKQAVRTKKRIQRTDGVWVVVTAYRLVTSDEASSA